MAVIYVDDVEHLFAANPKLESDDWAKENPTISSSYKFLRHKVTGEVFPNEPCFARRSDVLEPYIGDPFSSTPTVENLGTNSVGYEVTSSAGGNSDQLVTL